ncbi:putative transmembrane efflux protein [Actinacidiphila reveromycinica]|uniref:Putative transmembrane efflux protein n=1 Tax=Actinacidiphila reveromycinica TaxID=659352 RepID=A0A7U3VQZ4_9ACTN|nr:MFS transporter [Streptomyces sp. SN-593]BBB00145.1 putative transmembrane efflux protein [Streptomyces sp. SN-593]
MPTQRTPIGLIAAVFIGTFMALLDMSVVNVALPAIQSHLHASATGIQWVVDSYVLCLSAFMLTGGALGDRFGRKKVFLTGIALFTLSSALCSIAPDIGVLVTGRMLQGVGAAAVTPGALSLLAQGFPDPARRARMIGLWGACSGLAVVLGPVLGGLLTDHLGWRYIFLINLPLGVIALAAGIKGIAESSDPVHAAADPVGQVLGVVWLAALTYAVNEAGRKGWTSTEILSFFALALVAFVVFVVVESRTERAMLPVRLFRNARFATTNAASFVLGFGAYGTFFLLSLYLQEVQGASASMAGVKFLPYSATIALGSTQAGRLTARFGPRWIMVAGYGLISVGLLGLLGLSPTSGYLTVGLLFAVLGLGMGLAITPTNATAMSAVPRQRSGAAAATINASRQAGTALGIAALGSLLNARAASVVADRLGGSVTDADRHGIAHAVVAGHGRVPKGLSLGAHTVKGYFDDAFVAGLHRALLVAGVATAVATAAVLVLLLISADTASAPAAAPAPAPGPHPARPAGPSE